VSEVVLDASALLTLLNDEPGADVVAEALPGAVVSAVNMSEVAAKLCGAGMPEKVIHQVIDSLGLEIIPFDEAQAYQAGILYLAAKHAGLSLGDRACLGLAKILGLPALTADKTWKTLSIGVTVILVR